MKRFFESFSEHHVALQGHASNGCELVCWGTVRMTLAGERFGATPNGRCAELAMFLRFSFTDDRIASEHFFFDLSSLCTQSGISTDALRQKIFGEPVLAMETACT